MTSVENTLKPLTSVEVTAGPASLTTQHGALLPCPTGPAALAPPALLLQPAGPAALAPLAILLYYTQNHAGENLYHCAMCEESVASRNDLKRHMNGHNGNNSNHCAMCGEEFVSWNRLKFHIKDLYWR